MEVIIERESLDLDRVIPVDPNVTLWVSLQGGRKFKTRIEIATGCGDRLKKVRSRRKTLTRERKKD